MPGDKEKIRLSKFLSLVLRHQPEEIGIVLDDNGWADVEELLKKLQEKNVQIDRPLLEELVATNNKKRFAFDSTGKRIRASQGHSIKVNLGLEAHQPPEILFHGTAKVHIASILQQGILKKSRQQVHLSKDIETALKVGQRHGAPVVIEVQSGAMFLDGHQFYKSENGVWLTDFVPPKYLQIK